MKYVVAIIFCIVLIVPACAHGVSYETKHGFDVYLGTQSGPDQEELEAAVDMALATLVSKGIYTQKQVDRAIKEKGDFTSVHVREIENDTGFWCGKSSPSGYCWGRFWHQDLMIEITNQECISSTAMVHEMLHWAHWVTERRTDINHEDTRMFVSACRNVPAADQVNCMKNTVERTANLLLCVDRCGDLCVTAE